MTPDDPAPPAAVLDTSVFIASESRPTIATERLPHQSFVTVISIGELRAGVLAARDTETRARRLRTVELLSTLSALPVDESAAAEWARLRYRLYEVNRRVNTNDLWIASIAVSRNLPVVTQDANFNVLADLGGPEIVLV